MAFKEKDPPKKIWSPADKRAYHLEIQRDRRMREEYRRRLDPTSRQRRRQP